MGTTPKAAVGAIVLLGLGGHWLSGQNPPSRFIVPDALKNFEVMQNGKLVTEKVVQPAAAGARTLALTPGTVSVVFSTEKVSPFVATRAKTVLPAHVVFAPREPGGKPVSGTPSVYFTTIPMSWNNSLHAYASPVTVSLDSTAPASSSTGKVSIDLVVSNGGLVGMTGPILLALGGVSKGLYVTSLQTSEAVGLMLKVNGASLPVVTDTVAGKLASIRLQADHSQLEAYGGKANLHVSFFDPQPAPLALPGDLTVTFAVDGPGQPILALHVPAKSTAGDAIFVAAAPGDPITITASAEEFTAAEKIQVNSTARKLSFTANSPKALGLGFGKVDVTVTRVDATGSPVSDNAAMPVPVTVSAGQLIDERVQIPSGAASINFSVTNPDTGPVTVNSATGSVVNPLVITFVWPWAIVAATLIGSALGAYLRWIKLGGNSARNFPKLAGEAAAVSITVVAAVLLGIKYGPLPQALAATEGGAFFLGIFAGVTGVVALDTLFAPGDKKESGISANAA